MRGEQLEKAGFKVGGSGALQRWDEKVEVPGFWRSVYRSSGAGCSPVGLVPDVLPVAGMRNE